MSIASWSFTRFWATVGLIWLLAFALLAYLQRLGPGLAPLGAITLVALAFAPGFLAGSWAGTHPEIAGWPAGRLLVMWLLGLGSVVLTAGPLQAVGGFALGAIVAPLVVLTWAWRERRTVRRLRGDV
jgi:hypothetical protein